MTSDQFNQLHQRLDSIEQRLEEGFSRPASLVLDEVLALEQRTNERLDRLTERVERLAEGQQELQLTVRQLIEAIFQSSRNAEADRAVMREMQSQVQNIQTQMQGVQTENRRILDYLFGQRNGEGQ
ncbi:MAG TPA: hypothetical protein VK211_12710 [Kamptonema sp.]|nr:hypothetical protein [Kamptonema sp.]